MKNILLISFIFLFNTIVFSQTKEEKAQMQYVKDFFVQLKAIKINPEDELFWKFTYSDSSQATLTKLAKVLEKEGLKVMGLGKSKTEKDMYELTMYEKKTYKNTKVLNDRLTYLNSVAKIFNIINGDATLGASKPDKTTYVEDFDPEGKYKNKKNKD